MFLKLFREIRDLVIIKANIGVIRKHFRCTSNTDSNNHLFLKIMNICKTFSTMSEVCVNSLSVSPPHLLEHCMAQSRSRTTKHNISVNEHQLSLQEGKRQNEREGSDLD